MSGLKICIVGTGHWSRAMHLPAFKCMLNEERIDVVGVCDLQEAQAQEYAKELNCENIYTDVNKMLGEKKAEGLVILVPPGVSHQLIETALEYKIPFMCEKPPVKESALHKKLALKANGLKHLIAYNRRFSPYIQQARKWMEGVELLSVTAQFSRFKRMDEEFSSTAVHPIDTTQFLSGEEFEKGKMELIRKGGVANFYINGWSKSNIRFDILITPNTGSAEEKYVLKGTDKSVLISFPQVGMYDTPGFVELHENNQVTQHKSAVDFGIDEDDSSGLGGILNEHKAFVELLKGDSLSSSTLDNTYATQVIREDLYKMIMSGHDYCSKEIQI
ncbi:MAG: hypothetical protein COA79_12390 [Planctomycetota bacterium]|nr:MAG: hypothetical protein COA79_12390 [Planctomycetota bacterium]